MAKRLTAALGVDIGTQSIKTVAVRLTKDGPAVVGAASVPTPQGTIDHTGIFDPQALGAALKAAAAATGGGTKDVVFCISGQSAVLVRVLEVPRMSDAELADHMQWEIQRNIPFAETDVVSDFRPVDNPNLANTQNMEVVMAVSPRSAIDTVLALIRASGCRVGAIDVEPLGIGRVLRTCDPNGLGGANICLVHMGNSSTAINMYRSANLAFARTVPLGGSVLTKAISDALGISTDDAETRKVESAGIPETVSPAAPGTTVQIGLTPYSPFAEQPDEPQPPQPAPPQADDVADRIYRAMAPHLDEFVAEIRRSIDYFKSRGGEVEKIGLSGGGANLRGLDGYINRSLGIPVQKVNPFQGLSLSGQAETFAQHQASEFTVAVGMGLHIAYD